MSLKEKIVIAETGEEIYRDYTTEQIAEVAKVEAEAQAKAEAQAQAETKRQIALGKLAALGLEEDDLKALGL
jgi:hypothetical protein